jgi:predicted transposase YdaD
LATSEHGAEGTGATGKTTGAPASRGAEQAQQDAIPKLLAMGLSVEQIAEVLSLPVEVVRAVAES